MAERVRLGIIGYGLATTAVTGPLNKGERFSVVGCADTDHISRDKFTSDFGQPVFERAEELFDKVGLDAVYIATPTRLHESLVCMALERGINVLVEKPIATSLEAAEHMVASARSAGKVLMVNHKRSADRDILGMWQLTKTGDFGRVRAVNRWQYSAWFYRTRAEDEREPSVGGIVLRQGAHEFDCLRMLLPSPPVRIHGWTGDYDANRPGEGAYYAWLECADGTIASSIHNGYDHFLSDEFTVGLLPSEVIGSNHRGLTGLSAEEEHLLKRTVGHARPEALQSRVFGFTLMSCEGADLRPSMGGGVYVYDERGRREFRASGQTGTSVIIQELYDAVTTGATALHDGSWGLAVLECCLGIRESAATHGDVELTRQGSVPRAVAQGILGDREMAEATE